MAADPDECPMVITPEAFASQVGKTVPVRLGVGGPIVGWATVGEGGRVEMAMDVLPSAPAETEPGG